MNFNLIISDKVKFSLTLYRFWDVSRARQLQPTLTNLLPYSDLIFSVNREKLQLLSQEAHKYLELAADYVVNEGEMASQNCEFFISNKNQIPNFYDVFRLIALFQPSNCCSERLNAVYSSLDFDSHCLLESIQAATIVRYNHRTVK